MTIESDMETFIRVVAGSFRTASKEPMKTWDQVSRQLLNITMDEDNEMCINNNYGKLIIDCEFGKRLKNKKFSMSDSNNGGCEKFHQTLTSNGMCNTFNGKTPTDIWTPNSLLNSFNKVFPSKNLKTFNFGGMGSSEGNSKLFQNYFAPIN